MVRIPIHIGVYIKAPDFTSSFFARRGNPDRSRCLMSGSSVVRRGGQIFRPIKNLNTLFIGSYEGALKNTPSEPRAFNSI